MPRPIEEIIDTIDDWKEVGFPTFKAMESTLTASEWDHIFNELKRLWAYWKDRNPDLH